MILLWQFAIDILMQNASEIMRFFFDKLKKFYQIIFLLYTMKQIVSIHVGQAGIQLGNDSWALFCLEHGIQPDGFMPDQQIMKNNGDATFTNFFQEHTGSRYSPRSVHIDLGPQTIDNIRYGEYRHLFQPNQLLSGKQEAGNNFARGFYTQGEQMIDLALDRIRKAAEGCEDLQGFMIYHSTAGGTGSGFGSLLAQRISAQYSKETKANFPIFSSQQQSKIINQSYNQILSVNNMLSNIDICIPIDNKAIYRLCRDNLQIQSPKYTEMNKLAAHLVSQSTIGFRTQSCLNSSLGQMHKNLVPYPEIKFITASYSSILSHQKMQILGLDLTQKSISCFKDENQFINCSPQAGKYMACSMLYRGQTIVPKDVSRAFGTLKTKRMINFVDWSPAGFKVGISYRPPTFTPGQAFTDQQTVFVLSNQTAIKSFFNQMTQKFDKLFKKQAYLHWYTNQSMTEQFLVEAREKIESLKADYQQVECDESEGQEVEEY